MGFEDDLSFAGVALRNWPRAPTRFGAYRGIVISLLVGLFIIFFLPLLLFFGELLLIPVAAFAFHGHGWLRCEAVAAKSTMSRTGGWRKSRLVAEAWATRIERGLDTPASPRRTRETDPLA
jgi:hypothetical protein